MATTLFTGGTLFDGHRYAGAGDVLVRDGLILAVGRGLEGPATPPLGDNEGGRRAPGRDLRDLGDVRQVGRAQQRLRGLEVELEVRERLLPAGQPDVRVVGHGPPPVGRLHVSRSRADRGSSAP